MASATGTYTFRGLGDNYFAVYLSNATYNSTVTYATSENFLRETSASASDVFPNWYESDTGINTENTIDLVAYNRYYMEVYHVNVNSWGWFELGVEVPNTDATIEKYQTYEVHKVTTAMTSEAEIIRYNMTSGGSGNIMLRVQQTNSATLKVINDENVTIVYNATAS